MLKGHHSCQLFNNIDSHKIIQRKILQKTFLPTKPRKVAKRKYRKRRVENFPKIRLKIKINIINQ